MSHRDWVVMGHLWAVVLTLALMKWVAYGPVSGARWLAGGTAVVALIVVGVAVLNAQSEDDE